MASPSGEPNFFTGGTRSRLQITGSKKLKTEFIPFRKAAFGPRRNVPSTFITVPSKDNLLGAKDFPQGSFNCKIALFRRGEVNFSLKIFRAQQAGAVAVIIVNNEPDLRASMGAGDDASKICIPSLLIPQEAGRMLLKEVRKAGKKCKVKASFEFSTQDFVYGAVASGDVETVMRLIDRGTGINSDIVDDMPFRCNFLTTSAQNGHYNLVKALLDRKADVNKPDNRGSSPLSIASNAGHRRVVELLISRGADLHNICPGGRFRPIESARDQGHGEVVEILWNAMDKSNVRRCVFAAVVIGKTAFAREMLGSKKIDPDDTIDDQYGYTFLTKAARQGHTGLCELVLDHKASIDKCLPDTGRSALWLAAEQAKADVCRLLIGRGCNINLTTVNGGSALSIAAGGGYMDIVKFLVESKADIANNGGRFKPIESAALAGHKSVAAYLWKQVDKSSVVESMFNAVVVGDWSFVKKRLKNGVPVNSSNSEGFTMLTKAALLGQTQLVKELIKAKASVNDTTASNGRAPLWLAAEQNKMQVVKELLKLKANVNENTADGGSALSIAAGNGNLVVTKLLLKHKADIHNTRGKFRPIESAQIYNHDEVSQLLWEHCIENFSDDIPRKLHYACVVGNLNVIRDTLEEHQRDINDIIDSDGYTLLTKAAFIGHMHITKFLIAQKADVNRPTADDRTSALWLSAERSNRDILKLLIKHKADLDQTTQDGGCALSISCLEGHLDTVKTLVEAKADIHNTRGRFKPIESAHNKGHQKVVDYLWGHIQAARKDADDQHKHTMHSLRYAVACGRIDTVRGLVAEGVHVDSIIEDGGYTALMNSSWYGHIDLVLTLLNLGADVFKCNEKQNSALTIATQRKHNNIVRVLRNQIMDLQLCGTTPAACAPRADGLYFLCRQGDREVQPHDQPQLLAFLRLPEASARLIKNLPNESEPRAERNLVCWRRTNAQNSSTTNSSLKRTKIIKSFYDIHTICGSSKTVKARSTSKLSASWVNSFGSWRVDPKSRVVTARSVLQGAEADQDIQHSFETRDCGTNLVSYGKDRKPWYYYFIPISDSALQDEVRYRKTAREGLDVLGHNIPPTIIEVIIAFVAGTSRWSEIPIFEHIRTEKKKKKKKRAFALKGPATRGIG